MGILNATPDSFSDGGTHQTVDSALRRIDEMVEAGADWIDIGGESTRPGADPVSAEDEWARIGPIFEALASRPILPGLSVDTTKSEVARRALDCGAHVINDVSALTFDPQMADIAASSGAGLILMHMRGEPRTMQSDTHYADLHWEVREHLMSQVRYAFSRQVSPYQLVLDPGIGFGKNVKQNLELVSGLGHLGNLGFPTLVGASRKSFLGKILGGADVPERVHASVAVHVAAALAGAHFVRVHDVKETVQAVRVIDRLIAPA